MLPTLLVVCCVFFLLVLHLPDSIPSHAITATDLSLRLPKLDFSPNREHRAYYTSAASRDFCKAHGYTVFTTKSDSGERKIYDLFMVNTELDFLEIRLNTLYDYVDYFVIVESPLTFQGNPKNLTLRENWDRFKAFHDKIIYHEVQFPEDFSPVLTWDFEDLQRNAMYDQVIPMLRGRRAPVEGDVLLVADVDEIPRPSSLLILRTCNFPRRLTLASKFYYYSFQFRHQGPEWPHPQATFYEGNNTLRPTNLRTGDAGVPLLRTLEMGTLSNAAWHCSSCFPSIEDFLNKMASFSHMWMNEPQYQDRERIAAAVRDGRDLWGRREDTFTRVENNADVPKFLLEQRERFRYMLNRDGETAGFTDYP